MNHFLFSCLIMSLLSISVNSLSSLMTDDESHSHKYNNQLITNIQAENQKIDYLKQEIVEIYQDRIKRIQSDLDNEKEKFQETLTELQNEKFITQKFRNENIEMKEWVQKEFKILKDQINDLTEYINILNKNFIPNIFGTWRFNEYTMTIIARDSGFEIIRSHLENNKFKPTSVHWNNNKFYWTNTKEGIHTTDSVFVYDPINPRKIIETNSGRENIFIRQSQSVWLN